MGGGTEGLEKKQSISEKHIDLAKSRNVANKDHRVSPQGSQSFDIPNEDSNFVQEQWTVVNQNYIPQKFERDQAKCSSCSCYSCPRDQSWYSQGEVSLDNSNSKQEQIFNDIRDQSLDNNTNLLCASIPRDNNSRNPSFKSENSNDISPTESVNGSTRVKRVKEALIRGREYVRSKVSACKQKLPSLKESFRIRGGNFEKSIESSQQTGDENNDTLNKTSIFKKVIFSFNSETNNEWYTDERSVHENELAGCRNTEGMPGLMEDNDLSGSKPNLLKHVDENGQRVHVPGGGGDGKHVAFEDKALTTSMDIESPDSTQAGDISTIPEEDLDEFPLGTEAHTVTGLPKKILRKSHTCAPAVDSGPVDKRMDWLIGRESMPGSLSSDTSQITNASSDSVNSVEGLLAERTINADEMLMSLGFCSQMEANHDFSRIPERFYKTPQSLSGANIGQYLMEHDDLQHLLNVMESQRGGGQVSQQSYSRAPGMWHSPHSLSSVLHGMKFLSAVQSSQHNTQCEQTQADNMENSVQQSCSILHPDNRKELAKQGFYDFNNKAVSATWAEKLKQLQKSKSMGAEERRKNFQKSRIHNNNWSMSRNDPNESSSIEYDDQESPTRVRRSYELRSFSTDLSTSAESSDSSFSRDLSRTSKNSSSIADLRKTKQEEIQKIMDDEDSSKLNRSIDQMPHILQPTTSISEMRSKQVNQMEKGFYDGDYILSPKSSFDLQSEPPNGSDTKTRKKQSLSCERRSVIDSLEVPDNVMDRSDSDATITVTSPGYLSDTGSDFTVLESSISRRSGRLKGDSNSSKGDNLIFSVDSKHHQTSFPGEENEFYDENDNVKYLTENSSASMNMGKRNLNKCRSTTENKPSTPVHYISQVEKMCGFPDSEAPSDVERIKYSDQLPRMESAQSDSSGFVEADLSSEPYHETDTKLNSLGSGAADKTFLSSVTILPHPHASSQPPPSSSQGGRDRSANTHDNVNIDTSIHSVFAEKKQKLFFRETVTVPIKSYKTVDTRGNSKVTESDRKLLNKDFYSHPAVNLDHSYHKERPYKSSEILSVSEKDPQFVSQCEVEVTPSGSFKKRNSVSYLRPRQNEVYEKSYDRRRSCPQNSFVAHADRAGSAPHIVYPRIEEEDQKHFEPVNQTGAPRIVMERQATSEYHDYSSHVPPRSRSNSAFIAPTREIRQPVYFSTPNQNAGPYYQTVLQQPYINCRHQSISYKPSSPTFFSSYPSRHRSVGHLDFQRVRSPTSFQSSQIRHRSVGDCFRSSSPLWYYNINERGEGFPVSPVFLNDRPFRGSQSSLGSRSDYSHQSSGDISTCDENIEYKKLIKLINQPLDSKDENGGMPVVRYKPRNRLRTWPMLDKSQQLEEETQMMQCALQRYKAEIYGMESTLQNNYQQAMENLADEEKDEVEELLIIWEDLRREVSEAEQLLAKRMYGLISGNDNFNSMLGLSVVQQMIDLMKEQICQHRLSSHKDDEAIMYEEEITSHFQPLKEMYGFRPPTAMSDPVYRQRPIEDDLRAFREAMLQEVRDEMKAKTKMMQVQLQSKDNEIQRLQMELLVRNMQEGGRVPPGSDRVRLGNDNTGGRIILESDI
ncbi:hypothetical protein ScPMuIL_017067 [Solemya velum]